MVKTYENVLDELVIPQGNEFSTIININGRKITSIRLKDPYTGPPFEEVALSDTDIFKLAFYSSPLSAATPANMRVMRSPQGVIYAPSLKFDGSDVQMPKNEFEPATHFGVKLFRNGFEMTPAPIDLAFVVVSQ